jgi:hypothetical protein
MANAPLKASPAAVVSTGITAGGATRACVPSSARMNAPRRPSFSATLRAPSPRRASGRAQRIVDRPWPA